MVGMLSTEPEHVSGSKLSNADAEGQGAKSNKAARKTKAAAAAEAAAAEARAQEEEANDGNVTSVLATFPGTAAVRIRASRLDSERCHAK